MVYERFGGDAGFRTRSVSRRIIVVADARQVQEAMRQSLTQLAYLGRRYVLAETVSANTFHPKLIARLSSAGGRIWVGSGNLTYTGWGGNQEVATAWPIGPGAEDILACSDPKWPDLKQK
jgi:hypothetical protein